METSALLIVTAILHYALQLAVLVRALTRPGREPASRLAWVLVILSVPALGLVLYLLLGEVSPGRRRAQRMQAVRAALPTAFEGQGPVSLPEAAHPAFARAAAVNGFRPAGGNRATLAGSPAEALDHLIADVEAARRSVHVGVYIWLDDGTGRALAEALIRAAGRGVACRVLVDGLGSRGLIGSALWRRMAEAGVRQAIAFDTRWAAGRSLLGRVDIRNHRKIFVIDGGITHVGSRNCADPAFAPKARFGPWHDILLRLEGPVAWQMQALFAADWMGAGGDDLVAELAQRPEAASESGPESGPEGFPALAFGTGPDLSPGAVVDVVGLLLAAARREVVITTPYFVPTQALEDQLRATAIRGVAVTLILPARNDSRMVGWASRASYAGLLKAGVHLREHGPGLLHAKTLTIDGSLAMIGSANLDRRSFELNFENNLLVADRGVTGLIRDQQARYAAAARPVSADSVARWSLPRRLLSNVAAMVSPVL